MFLSRCAVHGSGVTADEAPSIAGRCRIRVGSHVRISGKLEIQSSAARTTDLTIGDGVFIGHGCTFAIGERIDIGSYASIGACTFVTDTFGHSHVLLDRPIWEDPAGPNDVGRIVIEDNVHIGRGCIILKGVRIGARSFIGAGSVVRSSIKPDAVVAGNPARVVGWRTAATEVSDLGTPISGVRPSEPSERAAEPRRHTFVA
jgi:acetyltransferase-like isoleucine patch superfamily enzyme